MEITSDDSPTELVGPADDDFHEPGDHRWFHETVWYWFFVPERRLGGWLYNWIRPNVGVSGGGCWIWDDTTSSHLEVPYYACYANLRLPEARDLRHLTFPSGVSVRAVEPLSRYELAFADRDIIALELEYEAVMPPWVPHSTGSSPSGGGTVGEHPRAHHLDQVGRVTGELVLHGERLDVDCLAIRDRTWAPRPERWKDGQVGYSNGASDDVAFLASTAGEEVRSGYLARDGRRAALVEGTRRLDRHPDHGYLRRITVEAVDSDGRELRAEGRSVSRMAIPIPGVHGVVWTSLVEWTVDGTPAWGEDQDAWPIHGWSAFRRRGSRLEPAAP